MASGKCTPRVLVVGAPGVGKSTLIRRLCGIDAAVQPQTEQVAPKETIWVVDTKYYTARVEVLECHLQPWSSSMPPLASPGNPIDVTPKVEPQADAREDLLPLMDSAEALVLVFDLTIHDSFLALQQWWSTASAHVQRPSTGDPTSSPIDVQLCVGNKADAIPCHPARACFLEQEASARNDPQQGHSGESTQGKQMTQATQSLLPEGSSTSSSLSADAAPPTDSTQSVTPQALEGALAGDSADAAAALEERRRGYMHWCLDRGIEYVESSALSDAFDRCLGPAEGDSPQSQGVPRVTAALQAHMWTGMELKNFPGSSARADLGQGPDEPPEDVSSVDAHSSGSSADGESEDGEELGEEELAKYMGYQNLDAGPEAHQEGDTDGWSSFQSSGAAPSPSDSSGGELAGQGPEVKPGADEHSSADDKESNTANTQLAAGGADGPSPPVAVPEAAQPESRRVARGLGMDADREDEEESHLSSLEQLMSRVAAVRQQGGSMSDAARRELAATTAMQLAALLSGRDDEE